MVVSIRRGEMLPKSPKSHRLDSIAIKALKAIFPEQWHYKSTAEDSNNHEYGDDLTIEIVDDNDYVTGIEFSVQNKANPKIRKDHISVSGIKLSTLRRLMRLNRPIMLHAFHQATKISYWLWLHEWYAQNHTPEWKNPKTVTVRIPKENILNEDAVKTIQAQVIFEHRKYDLIRKASQVTQASDFNVSVLSEEKSIILVVDPKNDDAIPSVIPLDAKTFEAIQFMFQTGKTVQLDGKIAIEGIPSLIADDFGTELVSAIVFPIASDVSWPLSIEYLDQDDVVIYKTRLVTMKLVEPGAVTRRWEGKPNNQPVTYSITENLQEGTRSFSVKSQAESQMIADLDKAIAATDAIDSTKKYRITEIETDQVFYMETSHQPRELTFEQDIIRKFIKYVALINERLGLKIELTPSIHINNEVFEIAEFIAGILTEGIGRIRAEAVVPEGHSLIEWVKPSALHELLNQYEQHGNITVFTPQTIELHIEFLGCKITLESAQYAFPNSKIAHVDVIRKRLDENISEDEAIQIGFDIDRTESYILFPKWYRNAQEENPQAN